ncbi:MAG TPA: hypothetical protein VKX49_12395 [Bryobacteraceae bacterium]|nr:hypothetical protein [Bryobacteraceae bacterium]
MAQKASDFRTVPLCLKHHRTGNDSLHKLGRRRFEERFGVDLLKQAERLASKIQVRVENGHYVGYLENEAIPLSPVERGIPAMIKLAVGIAKEKLR